MQISPINNVNFNGKFLKTPELKELLTVTDKETLTNFNKIIKQKSRKASGNNDIASESMVPYLRMADF